jgi:DUF4097 and DUF4098 domain-containing protein YvlB
MTFEGKASPHLTRTPLMALRLVCLVLFVASAFGAEEVNQRIDAAPDGIVNVENTAGSVDISGWPRNEVEVTGELGDDVERLVFERDGNEIVIRVEAQDRRRHGKNLSSDLVIRVPENSSVNASGVSTDIGVRGVRGELRLSTVSGDIESEAYGADAEIATVSGDLEVRGNGSAGYARFSTVSGDVDAANLAGELEATSVSGDLDIKGGTFERFNAQTTSGDIDFRAGLAGSGRMDVETINGDLEFILTGEISARFDIETFNGDIRNCFGPDPSRTSRYAPGRELKFTEGDGGARVTIRTLNGDLRLCRD